MSALERLAHELPASAAGSSNDQEIHGKACCLTFTPTALRLRTRHLVHVIVLAGVLGHLQADLLPPAGFGDGLVLDLHGFDALAKIARVSEMRIVSPTRKDPDSSRIAATERWP